MPANPFPTSVNKALWILKSERLRIFSAKDHPAKIPGGYRNFREFWGTEPEWQRVWQAMHSWRNSEGEKPENHNHDKEIGCFSQQTGKMYTPSSGECRNWKAIEQYF